MYVATNVGTNKLWPLWRHLVKWRHSYHVRWSEPPVPKSWLRPCNSPLKQSYYNPQPLKTALLITRSRTIRPWRFVAAVSSRVHFVANHFVAGTLRRLPFRFVAGTLRRQPFRRRDTSTLEHKEDGGIRPSSKTTWRTVCKPYLYIAYARLVYVCDLYALVFTYIVYALLVNIIS